MTAAADFALPPARQGFRWPAEWERHAATWLSWPHKEASWPGKLDRIPPVFVEMTRQLSRGEWVHINVLHKGMAAEVRARLARAGVTERVTVHIVANNDAWIRDHGPIFLSREGDGGAQMILDWRYNAWGGKYPPYALDDAVPHRVGELLEVPVLEPDMVLEGGSVDGDGEGTVLTTESCLLNPNRNPALDRTAIEQRLRDWLGARTILWLGDGIVGDDTDGHVDDITRFVAPGVVVTAVEPNRSDPNHEPLAANLERLRGMRDAAGRALTIHTLPMPAPVEQEGQRLPASYANFYIGNAVVLLPVFGCPQDAEAERTLARLFPGRAVAAMDARDLVWGLGAFHCLTQQQPQSGAPGPGYGAGTARPAASSLTEK